MLMIDDPQYTPMDLETHSKESTWVYGLFLDRMSHPVAQKVIKSHEDEMNILHLWRDICETMDKIIMIDIKPLDLLDSLTNKENRMIEWHGTQTQFVEMFEDMVNSLWTTEAGTLTSEHQLMTFLNDAVSGVPNLTPILHLMNSICKDTGPTRITWNKYLKEIRTRVMKYDLSECFTSDQNFCRKKHKNPPSNEMDFFKPGSGKLC